MASGAYDNVPSGSLAFTDDQFESILNFLEKLGYNFQGEDKRSVLQKAATFLPGILGAGFNMGGLPDLELPNIQPVLSGIEKEKQVTLGEQDRLTGSQSRAAATELHSSGLGPASIMEQISKVRRQGAANRGAIATRFNKQKSDVKFNYDQAMSQLKNQYNMANKQLKGQGISNFSSLLTLALGLL